MRRFPRPRSAASLVSTLWRRLFKNPWSLVALVGVTAALAAPVAVVQSRAGEKDSLRQAQIALATAPGALESVIASPEALLEGAPAGPSEYPLSRRRRDQLAQAVLGAKRFWQAPIARTLVAQAKVVDLRTTELMGLIAGHRLREANALHDRYIQPVADTLKADLIRAQRQLTQETQAADRTTWRATLAVVGVAGALMVLLLVGLANARRRRLRGEIEQGALRDSERRLRALVEHGSDMITVVRPDTTVIYQAGAVGAMLGYGAGELEGARLSEWLNAEDVASLTQLCGTATTASAELRLRHRDGSQRACEVHATNLRDDPAWEGIVLNIWDLSERKALEERLRHQAFHDALTDLPNRALVLDRAEIMLARARRDSGSVAALFVDLDSFKHVNDTLGHAAGDRLLEAVARRLQGVVRAQDTVGRLGGDEFVLLLDPDPSNIPPDLIAQRVLEVLRQPVDLPEAGRTVAVSASVGLAIGRQGSVDELLRDADFALYEAKRQGRASYVLFEASMQVEAQDRAALEGELQRAVELDQFFLLYQPTFDLHTNSVTGVEALIRWQHPARGVLAPDIFIPIAEQTRLIVPIGRWVLQEACRQAAAWHEAGHPIGMSVNISAHQLDQDGLEEDVERVLAESGLDPAKLTLEITETALMLDIDAATVRLKALKALGVRIAIDDFGTGHSSLAYLRKFPVDALKIDRSFISGIASSDAAAAIISTLVALGKTLGIKTLAEGIEQPAQLEKLQQEHCDQGQGFLFARPLDVPGIEEFLEAADTRSARTPATR
jgi:diguanylate cyclase (GGDEF)-like protein/PAS domain S-box-containing protein